MVPGSVLSSRSSVRYAAVSPLPQKKVGEMTRERTASLSASVGAGLLFATASFHLSAYSSVLARTPTDVRRLLAALWVSGGVSLVLSGMLAVAATPLFVVRRRAILGIAALTPLSIAVLQIIYLGFLAPTALLLLDTAVLLVAGQLGVARQAAPITATYRGRCSLAFVTSPRKIWRWRFKVGRAR